MKQTEIKTKAIRNGLSGRNQSKRQHDIILAGTERYHHRSDGKRE